MLRALFLCAFAVLVCGCGVPSPEPASTAPAVAGSTDSGQSNTDIPAVSGPPRANKYVQLGVTEAGFTPGSHSAPPGLRYYVVGLRGAGRSSGNDFALEIQKFVFAQNERGCISHPEASATWLKHPFGATAIFSAAQPTEGELAFLVPDDTQHIRVLIAPASGDGLVVPAGEDFTPSWPTPIQTIDDGSTLRVHVLPSPAQPPTLPPPAAGREQVVLDVVIENLKTTQGIEFTTSQQLRLENPAGSFVQPSALTKQINCRLDDGDVIPSGHARRLMVVYDLPAGAPRRLQYRGFEVDQVSVDLK
jgi:hypothetical protein